MRIARYVLRTDQSEDRDQSEDADSSAYAWLTRALDCSDDRASEVHVRTDMFVRHKNIIRYLH